MKNYRPLIYFAVIAILVPAIGSTPATAQEYWLLDEFSIETGFRADSLDTVIRIDVPGTQVGTEVDVEDSLDLDDSDDNIGIAFSWLLGRRHMLVGAWSSHQRSSVHTLTRDITVGDTVFPVSVDVVTDFDIETLTAAYYYFPVIKDRVALGVGGGLRDYDFAFAISALGTPLAEAADVSGPMPFIGFDYRYGISPRWRFRSQLGVFDIEIGDYDGSQVLAELAIEAKALNNLAFGVAGDIGQLDVDTTSDRWTGSLDSDILGVRAYASLVW